MIKKIQGIIVTLFTLWRGYIYNPSNMTRIHALMDTPLSLIGLISVVLLYYLFKIDLSPGYHGDEQSLLYIPWRFVNFHDFSYPIIFGDTFNGDYLRQYPPVMAFMLRNLLHSLFGFDAELGRVFSAIMMIIPIIMGAVLLRRDTGQQGWFLAACFVAVMALHPNTVLMARSIRFEQEIMFFGCFAYLLPLLFLSFSAPKWRNGIVWACAGFCAAWAATSHPWGVILGGVLGLSLLILHPTWREKDSLHWFMRLLCFGLGALPPVLATLYQIFHDFEDTRAYLNTIQSFYAVREGQLIRAGLRMYLLPDIKGPLGFFLANILELHTYGYAAGSFGRSGIHVTPFALLYKIIFWACIIHIIRSLPVLWRNRHDTQMLFPLLYCALALSYIGFLFIYTPNKTYFIYLSYFIIGGSFLLCAYDIQGKLLREIHSFMCILSLIFMVAYLLFLSLFISQKDISLDEEYQTLTQLSAKLLPQDATGTAYCANASWAACGKDAGTWRDFLMQQHDDVLKNIPQAKMFVIQPSLLRHFMTFFMMPEDPDQQKTEEVRRRQNWETLQTHFYMVGGYLGAKYKTQYLYFLPRKDGQEPLQNNTHIFAIFEKKTGIRTWWKTQDNLPPTNMLLSTGRYILYYPATEKIHLQNIVQKKFKNDIALVDIQKNKEFSEHFVVFDVTSPLILKPKILHNYTMRKLTILQEE